MNEQDAVKQATENGLAMLQELLHLMNLEGKVEAFPMADNQILLHISTQDAGRIIGRNAQVLDALQFLLNRMVFKRADVHVPRFIVDVERYRERRKDKILQEVYEVLDQVIQTGDSYRMAPMSAAERRVVHQALQDHNRVETYSEESEEDGRKRVVICRKGDQPAVPEPVPAPVENPPAVADPGAPPSA